jgi:hypothetical protein
VCFQKQLEGFQVGFGPANCVQGTQRDEDKRQAGRDRLDGEALVKVGDIEIQNRSKILRCETGFELRLRGLKP